MKDSACRPLQEEESDAAARARGEIPAKRSLLQGILWTSWALFLHLVFRIVFRVRITGRLPAKGNYVIAPSHSSHLDDPSVVLALPLGRIRDYRVLAARDYFFTTWTRSLMTRALLGGIPFDRGKDPTAFFAACHDLLSHSPGFILGIFPEGTRSLDGSIAPFKKGVGMLTAGKPWPVVPIYLQGTGDALPKGKWLPRPRRIQVHIGRPMYFQKTPRTREGFKSVAAAVEDEVRGLQREFRVAANRADRKGEQMQLSKTIKLALIDAFYHTVGRSSACVRLCLENGLTSGKVLDYVYRNQPSGRWIIGRWIDAQFLRHPTWEALRIRRKNIEEALAGVIGEMRKAGDRVALLDIASGPASYILSVLERVGSDGVAACCRDLDERWLAEGEREAKRRGITNVRFERADSLDRNTVLATQPVPNVVVASGFYDWMTDEATVKRSFAMLFEMLQPNGCFVLTYQTAHYDLEMANKVFTSFDHRPLRMVMRSQGLIHRWLEEAGFEVKGVRSDEAGYFAVTTAHKGADPGR